MKKNTIILAGMQTVALTLFFALPAQASINIGAPVSPSGSVVTIHSTATPYWTPAQTGTSTPVPVSTSNPVYVPVSNPVSVPVSTPMPVSTSAPAPASIPVITSSSGGTSVIAISNGQTGTSGSSVVSLKNIISNPSTSTVPSAPSTTSSSTSASSTPSNPSTPSTPTIPPATSLTADEQSMVDMVNQERAAAGLKPLKADLRLVAVARAKANDMATNNYFGHTSPTFGSPWAMMQDVGLNVQWAGENIAGNVSVSGAMAAWIASPAHLANILDPKFTAIGVGEAPGSSYNIYVQEFLQE